MGRTAVVTGGGTGIGRAIAKTLVNRGHGVVITGRRQGVLAATAAEIGASAVAFDATDPTAVAAALPELPARVDVLVNNAGGNVERDLTPPAAEDLVGLRDLWTAQFASNVLSAVLVTSALTPRLADHGRVILMGSIAGARGDGTYGAYGAAKAAVHNWAASLAFRLGERGITVNAVAPGFVEGTEFFGSALTEQRREWLISQTADGRPATPDDVANAVAFLVAPEAGHISGQVVHVNGGAFLGR